jgi:hypothetical protein
MEQTYLFSDESIISESDNKQVTLTTHRLRFQTSSNSTSFMLEKISSIQTIHQSAGILLLLGILVMIGGIAVGSQQQQMEQAAPAGILVGLVFILLYFFTIKNVAVVTADCGTKITIEMDGKKKEAMMDFINQVEKAKNDRYFKV